MNNKFFAVLTAVSVLIGAALPASAQWLTQTIVVSNGWTAAYLFVDPSSESIIPANPGVPLSVGNPIDKIWLWKAPPSTAQYITTPESPLSGGGPWVSWELTNSQNSLSALIPNAAYVIHSSSTNTYYWKVQGKPVPPRYTWDLTGLNLIGFPTPASNPPNFQSFLAPDPQISSVVQIYEYLGGELSVQPPNPAPVVSLYYTPVNRGEAFWMSATNVNNTYFGPFQLNLPDPSGLNYGLTGGQLTFYLLNETASNLTVTMKFLPSETPPYGQTSIAGTPPLLVEGAENTANLTYAYTPLASGGSYSWTLTPSGQTGSEVPITLGVNRFAMANAQPGSLYAGILEFSDSLGLISEDIPVSATSANNAGLWIGKVSVTNVSYDLKTYATNGDGSLVLSTVTNQIISTNLFNLGTTTNVLVDNSIISNLNVYQYNVTNLEIDTYTTNAFTTNSATFVISTNTDVNYVITSNLDIDTQVTGYYFTNNGELLVWETTNIQEPPVVNVQSNITLVLMTNMVASGPAGASVPITNYEVDSYAITTELATNAIFQDPVVSEVFQTNYSITTPSVSSNISYVVSGSVDVFGSYSVTNLPVITNYTTSNVEVFASATTNYYPAAQPLYEATNGGNLISVNVLTNQYLVTNVLNMYYITNYQVVSNNYTIASGATNQVSSTTNFVYTHSSAYGSETTNNYAELSLLTVTNPLYVVVTNYLTSSVSNYVVTSHITSGDSVPAPYPLRLIVFNDNSGNCSLLQRVYWGLDPDTNMIVSTTQDALDPNQLATARRITATHLPWTPTNTVWGFSGGSLALGATLTSAPIVENYDDQAANPFLHTYHPDHNNLDTENPPHELPMGSESYMITRVISLSMMPNTNDFLSLTSANSSLSGLYNESISLTGMGGFTKSYQTIGAFSLTQISTVSNLTTR